MPTNIARQPAPARVIAYGSTGIKKADFGRWVPFFDRLCIATLVIDSFTPRQIQRTDQGQSQRARAANEADLLLGLRLPN